MIDQEHLWRFLPVGYAATVAIELPILWFLLSRRHAPRVRLAAGFWLTAVTYPIVVVVLPLLLWTTQSRLVYLAVAETFAPAAECVLFYFAYITALPPDTRASRRDFLAITVANLVSFGAGELYHWLTWRYAG